jgi:hypothetical protein
MWKRWSAVGLVALVLAVVGVAQTGAGQSLLRAAGLAGPPPGYTALSFTNPAQLPTQLYSREALLDASFMIRNSSTAARRYDWQIFAAWNGRTRRLAGGQATVAAGRTGQVSRDVLASCASGQLQIVIKLAEPRESISYWATCWSAAKATP